MTISRSTYVQQAYEAIRQDILAGRLAAGSKVVVRPLSERLDLSPTPIKAALAALEREGFLIARAHRGYFVPDVSARDMREIYELREVIDGIAARNAARSPHRRPLLRQLRGLLERQRSLVAAGDLSGYSDLDLLFHRAIWLASDNARLARVSENLLGQVRAGSGSSAQIPGRLPGVLEEHAAIIAALAAGDSAEAERRTRAHVRGAGEALQRRLTATTHDDPGI